MRDYDIKHRPINCYSLEGDPLSQYKSIRHASAEISRGCLTSTIEQAILDACTDNMGGIAYGFIWEFDDSCNRCNLCHIWQDHT